MYFSRFIRIILSVTLRWSYSTFSLRPHLVQRFRPLLHHISVAFSISVYHGGSRIGRLLLQPNALGSAHYSRHGQAGDFNFLPWMRPRNTVSIHAVVVGKLKGCLMSFFWWYWVLSFKRRQNERSRKSTPAWKPSLARRGSSTGRRSWLLTWTIWKEVPRKRWLWWMNWRWPCNVSPFSGLTTRPWFRFATVGCSALSSCFCHAPFPAFCLPCWSGVIRTLGSISNTKGDTSRWETSVVSKCDSIWSPFLSFP